MAHFTITAAFGGDTVLRMLNYFVQRGLSPSRIHAVQSGEAMVIDIEQAGIDEPTASIIAAKMRNCFHVQAVEVAVSP